MLVQCSVAIVKWRCGHRRATETKPKEDYVMLILVLVYRIFLQCYAFIICNILTEKWTRRSVLASKFWYVSYFCITGWIVCRSLQRLWWVHKYVCLTYCRLSSYKFTTQGGRAINSCHTIYIHSFDSNYLNYIAKELLVIIKGKFLKYKMGSGS